MCAVRSSAIVLPTDTRGKGRGLLGCVGKGTSFKSDAGVGCVSVEGESHSLATRKLLTDFSLLRSRRNQ